MRQLPLIFIVTVLSIGCNHAQSSAQTPSSSRKTPAAKRTIFRGSFGEVFRYSAPVTVDHNPHGGATWALFNWEGTLLGDLKHIPLLPAGSDEHLVDVILEDIEKRYEGRNIIHTKFKNPAQCHFDSFHANLEHKGARFVYRLYVFFDNRTYRNLAQEMLRPQFGGYKFEFFVPESKYETIRPHLEEIIASFKPPSDKGPMK